MSTYAWRNSNNGAGGGFDVSADWNNLSTGEFPASTVPGANDLANLFAGGGTLTGSGAVDTLAFAASAWTIAGQLTATTISIDSSAVNVTVSGGELVANGALNLGLGGTAALTVASGGVVAVTAGSSGRTSSVGNANLFVISGGLASFGGALNLGGNGFNASAVVNGAVMTVGGLFQIGAGPIGAGSGSLSIQAGGEVVLSAAANATTPLLQLGALAGTTGTVSVDGATSLLVVSSNTGSIGAVGSGTLSITNGGAARFSASGNNAMNPALSIGRLGSGTVTVVGAGSQLAASGSLIVGGAGSGTLRVLGGATATSVGFTAAQAALAVAAAAGGSGSISIDGAGSQLTANGAAVVGGDNRGSGLIGGGIGSIAVTGGGVLYTGGMTILAGSQVGIDGSSLASISGDLFTAGTLSSSGTLVVTGSVYGGGVLQIGGGIADIGALGSASVASATVSFTAGNATLRIHSLTGASTIAAMQYGDEIDLVGNTSVRLAGNTITTTTGSLTLAAAPTGSQYELLSDGAGGTFIALSADTIGVYRFFDSNYGTHFFSASVSEKDTIVSTRPDLVYEGIGLQSIDPASGDPNASPVYRFFDTKYGTHFFTASASERDTIIATRSDLSFEGTGFIEHVTQEPGDTAVYRFFDTHYGTHFYTADANERATIVATRPDLVDEGIGFYAPSS